MSGSAGGREAAFAAMPPGSDDAVAAGCRCPVYDNARGKGGMPDPHGGPPLYWINEECPMHNWVYGTHVEETSHVG